MTKSNCQGQHWYSGRVNHNDHKSLNGRRDVRRCLQIAHVTPLKTFTRSKWYINFRLVSGFNFVSKLIEKIVASQVKSHMHNSGISNNPQSAYKSAHSTRTTLSNIQNYILSAQDLVNLLLFRSWINLRHLTRSILTSCSVVWLSGLALIMVWCYSGFDPTWRSKRNYGHSSFVDAAPRLWNKLPFDIRWSKLSHYFRKKNKNIFLD